MLGILNDAGIDDDANDEGELCYRLGWVDSVGHRVDGDREGF
jgi:hypothetical protein